MPVTTCPTCGGQMQVDESDLGYELECPHCAARFTPPKPKTLRTAVTTKAFDDDDEPRRRSRGGSRRRSAYEPPTARERERTVARGRTVGLWMLIVGYGALVLHVLIGIGLIILGIVLMQEPKKPFQKDDGAEVALGFGIGVIVFGILPMIPVIVGGHKLRRLDTMVSPFWVYAAAICSVGLMVLCTGWPVFWATGGIGIWAMVAISNTEAQRLLKDNESRGRDERTYDDEL